MSRDLYTSIMYMVLIVRQTDMRTTKPLVPEHGCF